jgi:hypothetical protein
MEPVGGGPCQGGSDCPSNLPVCDQTLNEGTCVLCTDSDRQQCTGMTPRCEDRKCVACVDDNDCGDRGVCLSEGDCAAASRIIHVKASGGSNTAGCGAIDNECTLTRAFTEVTTDRNIVKLDDATIYTSPAGGFRIDTNTPFTIDARGAELRRSDSGPVLFIDDDGFVTILGGTIAGSQSSSTHGAECRHRATLVIEGTTITGNDESGIFADQCTLRINKAIISNNSSRTGVRVPAVDVRNGSVTMSLSKLLSNKGGGVRTTNDTAFVIVGSLFHNNGQGVSPTSSVSALSLDSTSAPMNRLEFNTIVDNHASTSLAQGISCVVDNFTARNNIVWNTQSPTDTLIEGSCSHAYSNVRQVLLDPINGPGNLNDDPSFESLSDFRVKPGSPVDGRADPQANLDGIASVDLAGQTRTAPADIGAYEVPTQ